jgi:hypothetical protein
MARDRSEQIHVQLLEIAVGNVVVAPVRNGVELDAVGELHLVLLLEPAALLGPLDVVLALAFPDGVAVLLCRGGVFDELNLVGRVVERGTARAPSSVDTACGCLSVRRGQIRCS